MEFWSSFTIAYDLIRSFDADLVEVVVLSLRVSISALGLSALIGLPLGALLATRKFPMRRGLIVLVNALLALPPVVVGLVVYMTLSNAGPFGWLQLLYTPTAMIIAQLILVTPIVTALSRQILEESNHQYHEQLLSLGVTGLDKILTLLFEARHALLTVLLAGFGRAISEVGAVIIVGGNINHVTRVMTTTIALETSKGDLGLALALGIILLAIALVVNIAVASIKQLQGRQDYVYAA
ncbi:MAG: ABC transporter permease [Gammaproteobacteria bacterium]